MSDLNIYQNEQVRDAERAVLGGLMLETSRFDTVIQIIKDVKKYKTKKNTILFSPASASFDQYLNFEKRGEHFKTLSKRYARKYI